MIRIKIPRLEDLMLLVNSKSERLRLGGCCYDDMMRLVNRETKGQISLVSLSGRRLVSRQQNIFGCDGLGWLGVKTEDTRTLAWDRFYVDRKRRIFYLTEYLGKEVRNSSYNELIKYCKRNSDYKLDIIDQIASI